MLEKLSCEVNFGTLAKLIIGKTGSGIIHRGNYQDCIDDPAMKYAFMTISNGNAQPGYFGACLPSFCEDSLIVSSLNSALMTINERFSVLGLDSHTQDYEFPLSWISYLTISILVGTISIGAFSTLRYLRNGKKKEKSILGCFNVITNLETSFQFKKNGQLGAMDAARSLATIWIVLAHSFTLLIGMGASNIINILELTSSNFILFIEGAQQAVDMFFGLGGFFAAFAILGKEVTLKRCGIRIINRALRLLPSYALAMLVYYSLLMKLGSGPIWRWNEAQTQKCGTMWREMLFISNFIDNGRNGCLGWGWYIQVDFQLFVVAVMLLYLYSKKKWAFYLVTVLMGLASTAYHFVYTFQNDIRIITDRSPCPKMGDYMVEVYNQPHGRCVPYLIGLVIGVLFMEYRKQNQINPASKRALFYKVKTFFLSHQKIRVLFEWTGLGIIFSIIAIPRSIHFGPKWSQLDHSLYWTFQKHIFTLAMFMTMLPSCLGIRHSFFNLILNAKIFTFLARISYSTYLFHLMAIYHFYYSRNYDFYWNDLDLFHVFAGELMIGTVIGFTVTLLYELPFSMILMIKQSKSDSKPKDSIRINEGVIEEQIGLKVQK